VKRTCVTSASFVIGVLCVGGNKPGFASIIRHYPDELLTIVVLRNVDNEIAPNADADVDAISYRVAELSLRPLASR
jgi:hypothetical protein